MERARVALRVAFSENHPPHLIAVNFAFGMFVTTLPNLGAVVPVLAWIGYRFDWASRLAFFAAVVIAAIGFTIVSYVIAYWTVHAVRQHG